MKIGIIGGGQLARMLALSGIPLGIDFTILDPQPTCPAAQLGKLIIAAYDDEKALQELSDSVDVITFEFENISASSLSFLELSGKLFPTSKALAVSQERGDEKDFLRHCGAVLPQYRRIQSSNELKQALAEIGYPTILKTARLGYDGKGQQKILSPEQIPATEKLLEVPCVLEEMIHFQREVSLIGVRSRAGEIRFYPLCENTHREGVLHQTIAPAAISPQLELKAHTLMTTVMKELQYVGILTIEFFLLDDRLLVNEIAPRVHNSGHWTIEGAVTSQFENHIRAISGLPLGATDATGKSVMTNLLGSHDALHKLLEDPSHHVHLYGKEARPGRKLGHITRVSPL